MTKDEAWEAFKFTIYSDQPFTAIEEAADAYAQAHTKAALADTLGLLEAQVGPDAGDSVSQYVGKRRRRELEIVRLVNGRLHYRINDELADRDDALALLAREEKKEC